MVFQKVKEQLTAVRGAMARVEEGALVRDDLMPLI